MNANQTDSSDGRSETFEVGDLLIDVGQQRVTRAGQEIPLPNLSFKMLLALVRAAPNFLSNELLMERVWPGIVVSPETVSKRAALLRDALGDEPREPRYIAGLRSRGYRIIAPVSTASRAGTSELPPPRAPPLPADPLQPVDATPSPPARRRRLKAAAALVAVLFISAAILTAVLRHLWSVDRNASQRTVAVLPFDNVSPNANDAYLAMGIPEMLLNRMSSVRGLSVIARGSSFSIDTKALEPRDIGKRLGSGYLVEGSVQREGERLRIAIELIETATNKLIWSERFDRGMGDILHLEDEIGDQLTDVLLARLGGLTATPVVRERSDNIEAYLAFLRGRTLLGRFTITDSDAAVAEFQRAIELDPHFASAYASLYDARMQAAARRYLDLAPLRVEYRPLIDRALQIDPNSGAAYFARAMWEDSAPGKARDADFAKGAELDPSNGRGLTAYAEYLDNDERPAEASRVLQRALRIDPISPRAHYWDAIRSLEVYGGDVVQQKMLEVLELDPNFVPALQRYGKYRWQHQGALAEAAQIEEHAIALDPANSWTRHTAMAIYLDLGDIEAARDVAAGTSESSAAAPMLVSLWSGDWRAAGIAAAEGQPGWQFNLFENWGAAQALRDFAINTGEIAPAIKFIRSKFGLNAEPPFGLELENFQQAVFLSQLLAAQGDTQHAVELRHAAEKWNDANEAKYGPLYARRLRATTLLLDGKQDAALAELAESFAAGDYVLWWYTMKYDPVWTPLHNDPRFQAIATKVDTFIAAQRAMLQLHRQQGVIPLRGPAATAH